VSLLSFRLRISAQNRVLAFVLDFILDFEETEKTKKRLHNKETTRQTQDEDFAVSKCKKITNRQTLKNLIG
jgi:hypothetical protein